MNDAGYKIGIEHIYSPQSKACDTEKNLEWGIQDAGCRMQDWNRPQSTVDSPQSKACDTEKNLEWGIQDAGFRGQKRKW